MTTDWNDCLTGLETIAHSFECIINENEIKNKHGGINMNEERLIKTTAEYLSYFTEIKFEDHETIDLNLISSFLIDILRCMEVGTSKDDLVPFNELFDILDKAETDIKNNPAQYWGDCVHLTSLDYYHEKRENTERVIRGCKNEP